MKEDVLRFMEGSIFHYLGVLFRKHAVTPVLVGGYAVIAHKIQRMTFDIDFIITPDDFVKLEADLLAEGYSIYSRSEAFVQLKSEKPGLRDLDFLISDGKTIRSLMAQGREVSIAAEKFIVPSPVHLIAMKLHSIAGNKKRVLKDFPDIVRLLSANDIDPACDEIRNLFRKYDALELYAKVIESIEEINGR